MLYVVVEEAWLLPKGERNAKFIREIGSRGAADKESAIEIAKSLASKFNHSNFEENAPHPYWWGRSDGAWEFRRFVIRPA